MKDETDNVLDADILLIEKALDGLVEHFDTVHIFCTRSNPDETTTTVGKGRGNWFARYGQIRHWLNREDEVDRLKASD